MLYRYCRKDMSKMCYTIEEIKEKITPLAKDSGVQTMYLFGSYARGEANDNSDVDIYIDKGNLKSLIQYYSFVAKIEQSLGCHVDVVTTGIQDKDFLKGIMKEGVLLHER